MESRGDRSTTIMEYQGLVDAIGQSGRPYNMEMIRHAYDVAAAAHGDARRRSGEPYITHPLSVAALLVDMGMDSESVAAALLHDVVEDTSIPLSRLKNEFGEDVAHLVDGVTKLTRISFSSVEEQQAENLRKMLLAMSQDVRVMLVKLCDRLHNMRTADGWPPQKRRDKSLETMEVYAPIAHRLGISNWRTSACGIWTRSGMRRSAACSTATAAPSSSSPTSQTKSASVWPKTA